VARPQNADFPPASPAIIAEVIGTQLGRAVETIQRLPSGLDVRSFYRVHLGGEALPARLIARVEPEPGAASDLEPIRSLLAHHQLPVPARYASAPGLELLEDLGDQSLELLANRIAADRRDKLYAEACDLVPRLQRVPLPFERSLDAQLIAGKARKWLDWALPLAFGRRASPAEEAATHAAFGLIAQECARAPRRLAHRDFKAANLLLRPARSSQPAELCMIDLQGVFLAPPEYDLVCLLRDSQVALPEDTVDFLCERIRPELPDAPGREEFLRRFDLITVARVAKDIAHYLHAATQRGDRRYLPFVPRGLANLRAAARRAGEREADMAPLAEIIEGMPAHFEITPESAPETET
jgi:aminoglycoside/choline kinase family phosphotransferase